MYTLPRLFDTSFFEEYYTGSASGAFFSTKTMSKLIEYIRDTKGELKHVSWPTRKQAIAFTVIVIAISLIVSIYLGLLDALFSWGLKLMIAK